MNDDITGVRVAVTGAAGFIGSHVVDWLVACGALVHGVDDLSGGFVENCNPRSELTLVDVRKFEEVECWLDRVQPEVVYHLAADATEGRSQFTPISATERNYLGYINVLTSAIRHRARKIVFTSSMSVYGAQHPPFTENMPRSPVDIYGIAKAASEAATEVMSAVHGIEYTIIRPHNVYGPRQCMSDPYRNVVAIFISRALQGQSVMIYGSGEQERAFSYIDDCAPLIAESGFRKDLNGEILNVGSSIPCSINSLVRALELELGAPIVREHVPDRPREVQRAWCGHEKMHDFFTFDEGETDLEVGLRRTVGWVLDRYDGGVLLPEMTYLDHLEIENEQTPKTWTERRI